MKTAAAVLLLALAACAPQQAPAPNTADPAQTNDASTEAPANEAPANEAVANSTDQMTDPDPVKLPPSNQPVVADPEQPEDGMPPTEPDR
jgi:hypothetical protein